MYVMYLLVNNVTDMPKFNIHFLVVLYHSSRHLKILVMTQTLHYLHYINLQGICSSDHLVNLLYVIQFICSFVHLIEYRPVQVEFDLRK